MSLSYHNSVLSPQTISGESPVSFVTKANANWQLSKTELQSVSDAIQDAISSLFGQGLLTIPSVTISGSALAVTIGDFKALIGTEVVWEEGIFNALANQTGGVCYFCQDGTFASTLPTTKSYAIVGTYNSNSTGVTSFTVSGHLLIPQLVTVTGTIADVYVPDDVDYAEGYLDHSSSALFAVDGCLKLEVSDNDAFTIEELYPGGMIDEDSHFATIPPQQRTNGGFWYKVSRKEAYPYASDPTVDITYTRTGLRVAQ